MLELITLDPEFHRLFNLLSVHQVMLGDELRISRFAKAISETVKEGDVVVDLGTGTGILAFLAVKAGAKKVYAIERNDIINLAREVAQVNRMEDRVVFCQADARAVQLPERADVIISETIGHMGVAEDFLENMAHARQHFLKTGGKLLPERMAVYVAPVECQEAYAHIGFWNRPFCGLDFSPVVRHASSKPHIHRFRPRDLLARPSQIANLDLYAAPQLPLQAHIEFRVPTPGQLHGLAGWFKVDLTKHTQIDTSPFSQPTHWDQTFFPAAECRALSPGILLRCDLMLDKIGKSYGCSWKMALLNDERGARILVPQISNR